MSEWENSLNIEHSGKKINPLKQKDVRKKWFFRDTFHQPCIKKQYYSGKKVLVSSSTKENVDERTKNDFYGADN